jgi:hypothetical protein
MRINISKVLLLCISLTTSQAATTSWLDQPISVGLYIEEQGKLPSSVNKVKRNFYQELMLELRNYRHIEILGKNTMSAARESIPAKTKNSREFASLISSAAGTDFTILLILEPGFRRNTMNISGLVYQKSTGKTRKLDSETVSAEDNSAGYLARLSQNIHLQVRALNQKREDTRTVLFINSHNKVSSHRMEKFTKVLKEKYINDVDTLVNISEKPAGKDFSLPKDFYSKNGYSKKELMNYQKETLQKIHKESEADHIFLWRAVEPTSQGAEVHIEMLVYSGFLNELKNAGTFIKGPLIVRGKNLIKESWAAVQLMISAERDHIDRMILLNAEYLAAEGFQVHQRYVLEQDQEEEISEVIKKPDPPGLPSFELGFTALGTGIYGSFDFAWKPFNQETIALELSATYAPRDNFTYGSIMAGARAHWSFLFFSAGVAGINAYLEQGSDSLMNNLNTVPYASTGIHFNIFGSLYVKAYGTALYNQKIIPWGGAGFGIIF